MQLRMARLCLDCEEVHEAPQCPVCASESFAFLTRWIPAPERRLHPRAPEEHPSVAQDRLAAVRGLTSGRALTRGLLGVTSLGVLGWLVGRGVRRPVAAGTGQPREER